MGLWNWLTGLFDHGGGMADASSSHHSDINPATGLPMVGGIGGVDVAGNPIGTNHDRWQSHDCFHDHSSHRGGFDD